MRVGARCSNGWLTTVPAGVIQDCTYKALAGVPQGRRLVPSAARADLACRAGRGWRLPTESSLLGSRPSHELRDRHLNLMHRWCPADRHEPLFARRCDSHDTTSCSSPWTCSPAKRPAITCSAATTGGFLKSLRATGKQVSRGRRSCRGPTPACGPWLRSTSA